MNYRRIFGAATLFALALSGCNTPTSAPEPNQGATAIDPESAQATLNPDLWPELARKPLDPEHEAQIDALMAQMTLEQKVGQTIQADSGSVTPEEVRQYRLGSVLSGGNSAPGPLPYADAGTWLAAADAYYNASIDTTDVAVAIPVIWGIDAVHGHANLLGATIFPHNIGLGATRNPDLIEHISRVTARELAVSGHDWTFAPTLAAPRDDRWGRTYEGFSESPEIIVSYSDRIVEGLQGQMGTDGFMADGRVISAAKHFLADGGTQNGADQGDAKISEAELRDVHAAGYIPALEAGVQSVMISFSSWHGIKMTGNKTLITDILKDRMGFQGFVVSDWNAHGQIPGCSNTDCPAAFNAGIDMFMAPDSWKGLYESTLAHVKSGTISQERLDDAVRRILRVKLAAGLFDKGAPGTRAFAGDTSLLGSPEHRALAREAVRQSLVLLKNQNGVLPLNAGQTVLVIGDGADNIAKAAGGWTLSWQGGDHGNDEFPNSQSILAGIEDAVTAAGGRVIFDPAGTSGVEADIVIAVYGEDPYAEFQGDRADLDFTTETFDTGQLAAWRARGVPVVSVFLSGRPLWVNPEINASDAFVAAWLPGSEGGGIADLLFRSAPHYDFTGRLSFSWPKTAVQTDLNTGDAAYDPLFAYGYGLTYEADGNLGALPETSGRRETGTDNTNVFYTAGQPVKPWSIFARVDGTDQRINELPWQSHKLSISKIDRNAQEDSLRLQWRDTGPDVRIAAFTPVDLSRQSNGSMELAFHIRTEGDAPASVEIGMGCGDAADCAAYLPMNVAPGDWTERRIGLGCFADAGVDMMALSEIFMIRARGGTDISLSDIRLASDTDATMTCGDED